MRFDEVILLSPHPDDIEFSCGATVNKLAQQGANIYYVVFSPCNKSLPNGYKEDDIYKELDESTKKLGIPEENVIKFRFSVRDFPENRQAILEEMVKLNKDIQPDLVFLPNSKDVHQDHQTIHQEGVRAFKHAKLLGYELPWNSFEFTSNCHVEISRENLEAKFAAISEFKSQQKRNYCNKEFFEGLAKVRGTQNNTEFAEAFEVIHWNL